MSSSKRTTDHAKIRQWAEKRLAFVYQDMTAAGEQSHFNKFVSR